VQLHGSEPIEWANLIPCPVIRAFKPEEASLASTGYHSIPLIDSGAGGTGEKVAAEQVKKRLQGNEGLRIMLAGGLNAKNVPDVIEGLGPMAGRVVGVDVSSGVETDGEQDLEKIRAFVKAAKDIEVRG